MNIYEILRNTSKLVKKLKGYTLKKLPIYLLLTIVDYKPWYQIKVETMRFYQND